MATAPDRVEPVFGDALAGDGGMADPVPTGPRRDPSFDVFPDPLSALPLPPLTFVAPSTVGGGSAGGSVGAAGGQPWPGPPTGRPVQAPRAAGRGPAAGSPTSARQTRPAPPANPGGVVAPGSGRRPMAGLGYSPPPTSTSTVVRPPAYLPQNQGLAQLRAAVQQARGAVRPSPTAAARPASNPSTRPAPPSAVLPGSPAGRRKGRASSVWSLVIFAVILLISTGLGQNVIEALNDLWGHR